MAEIGLLLRRKALISAKNVLYILKMSKTPDRSRSPVGEHYFSGRIRGTVN
jgi:hypothetical protein